MVSINNILACINTIICNGTILIIVLVMNLLGDWLRDVLNPKLYKG